MMRNQRWLWGAVCAIGLVGCKSTDPSNAASVASSKPYVLTTTAMIADTVVRIAGDTVTVESLMGTGVDPHLFKPSASDIARLKRADIIFYNGLHLEGKMSDLLERLSKTRTVFAVASKIPHDKLRKPPAFSGNHDPHIWFDVGLWSMIVAPVADTLSQAFVNHRTTYQSRARAWHKELQSLDSWVDGELKKVAEQQRVLVTAHDAFGYFGRRYGFEVVGLQGLSTVTEAGLSDVQRVVDVIVSRKIKAIFVESSVPKRTIEAVQLACQRKGHAVQIGGQLFSDAMGAPHTTESTYPGMIRYNVNTIVNALK